MKQIRYLLLIPALICLLGGPSAAWAGSSATLEEEQTNTTHKFPLGGSILFTNEMGIGTFASGNERRPSYTWTLSFRPLWRITKKQQLRARFEIYQQVVQNFESSTTERQQLLPSDLELRYTYVGALSLPDLGIRVSPYLSLLAPTSLDARFRDLIVAIRPGASVSWNWRWFTLYYETRFSKNFNRFTSPTVTGDSGTVAARIRGNEDVAANLISVGGNNVEMSWLNRATLEFSLPAKLSLVLDYVFVKSWTYATDSQADDEFRNANADVGRGTRDLQQGVIELGWQTPIDFLSLSLGMYTLEPPKHADNEGVRFPFFDFTSPANNYTSVYLTVAATY